MKNNNNERCLAILDSVKNRIQNSELVEDLRTQFDEVHIIKHPDDNTSYGDKRVFETAHNKSHFRYVFCINSSAAIQYGCAGSTILLHPDSSTLKLLSDESDLQKKYIGPRVYYEFKAKMQPNSVWKKFISANGESFRRNIRSALL